MADWKRAFSIDHRSVRLFRFGLGVFIVADVFFRLQDFAAWHLESGVVPLRLVHSHMTLFALSSSPLWADTLFAIYVLIGLLLMTGLRPRTVSIAAFILAISVKNRNS